METNDYTYEEKQIQTGAFSAKASINAIIVQTADGLNNTGKGLPSPAVSCGKSSVRKVLRFPNRALQRRFLRAAEALQQVRTG